MRCEGFQPLISHTELDSSKALKKGYLIKDESFSFNIPLNSSSSILEKLKQTQSPIKIKKAKLRSKAELYGCFVYINKKLFLEK